jgi:hypothetical protein
MVILICLGAAIKFSSDAYVGGAIKVFDIHCGYHCGFVIYCGYHCGFDTCVGGALMI